MATSGASSYGGSGGSSKSTFNPKRERGGVDQDQDQGDNLLDRRSSLEYGIFGVLFTLSKEKSEHRIRIRWVLLKILLDGWQLFTTVISPGTRQPWSINPHSTAWGIIGVLNFTWLGSLGYGAYLAVLYAMLTLLAINIVMCVWVAWCFKEHKFPVVWPIKVLRVFSSIFFQAFDVASLNLLQLGITCRFTGDVTPKLHFDLFDRYSCTAPPHIMHAVVSALCLILFVAIALLLNMAEVEVNPLSRRPMALGHSGAEVTAFAIKVLMTLVNVFIGLPRVEAGIYLALSLALAWQTLRWSPNLVSWVNYLKAGVSLMVVWCSAVLLLLVFHPGIKKSDKDKMGTWAENMTILMIAGLAPAFGVGALISWASLRSVLAAALRGLENPKKLPMVEAFTRIDEPRDVEIASRHCRKWKEPTVLDRDAVNKAHQLIKAGLEMFPTSAFMVLLHANFMIDVLGISQSGSRRIEDARKLNPSLICRFIMFVRQQQATQHAAGSSVSATMDLLGYVEYQRKQRMVVRLHREALQAMCNFWKALDASSVSFTHLSKSLAKIETSVSQAQRAYRVVLESYGNNPKLVHLYGRFLQTIKNDPWHAAEYFAEAERLQELQDSNSGGPLMPDGTPLSRMDEIDTCVLVLNASGEVQMANRHTQHLFGYKRGSLEGKPLSTLLAPHYARRLSERLASIATAHDLLAIGQTNEVELDDEMVVGLHSDRLAFQAKLSLRKASGVGEDSTIIAIIEPVLPIPGVCSVWVTHNGIVTACDPAFVTNFGWRANEVNGTSIKGLLTFPSPPQAEAGTAKNGQAENRMSWVNAPTRPNESASDIIKRLLASQEAAAVAAAAAAVTAQMDVEAACGNTGSGPQDSGMTVLVPHKYMRKPLGCSLSIVPSAATDSPIVHEIRIKLDSDPVQLLAVNRKGTILHASAELAGRLTDRSAAQLGGLTDLGLGGGGHHIHDGGHLANGDTGALGGEQTFSSSPGLTGYTLFDFLSPAWKEMHFKLLKDITPVSPLPVSELSCRKAAAAGPTMELRTARGRPLYVRVGVATTEVQGEMVHIIHVARSSLDEALAERRLRLNISPDGFIAAVEAGNSSQLFGMEASRFLGRGLWEIVEDPAHPAPATARASLTSIMTRDVANLIKRSLKYPGHSWRVQVVPPPSRGGRVSFTQQARPAIMQINVVIPADDDGSEDPVVQVDLWPVSTVVGVMELDQYGRIRAVLEESTRPAGLMFGVPTPSLVGSQLGELVAMPPGRTKPTDLLFLNATKKSSLKTASQTKEASVKVGPVHKLRATHLDGRPLTLEVQVIGKPGSNDPCTAILKIHQAPMVPLLIEVQPPLPPPALAGTGEPPQLPSQKPQLIKTISPQRPKLRTPPTTSPTLAVLPATAAAQAPMTTTAMMTTTTAEAAVAGANKVVPETVEETVLQMFEDGCGADASATAAVTTFAGPAGVDVAPPGSITPQRTPSLEETKRRISSPWRAPIGASGPTQSPPVLRSLSTPPAAKYPAAPGATSKEGADRELLTQYLKDEDDAAPSPNAGAAADVNADEDEDEVARDGVGFHQPGRNKLADLVKSVDGVRGASRHVQPLPGSASGAKRTSARIRSPPMRDRPSSPQGAAGFAEDPDGKTHNSGGSDGDVSDADEAGRAKATDRVLEWVTSKGAYYQNSMPTEGGTKGGGDYSDDSRLEEHGGATAEFRSSPLPGPGAGIPIERFAFSPVNDSRPPEFKGRLGLAAAGDGLPAPTGLEEDDGASDGGQSAVSGAQSATGSEYTRGKRFRKLIKVMDSSQTLQVQKRLRIHSLLVVSLMAVVHIICFVLTVTVIQQQKTSMLQLGRTGQAQLYMHRIMIDTRALDVISHNKALDNLYTSADAQKFVKRISKDAEELKIRFNEVLNTHSESSVIIKLLYQTKRQVWDTNDADGSDIYTNLTIWDFATRFYSMSKELEQNYDNWVTDRAYIADTYPGQFLLKSGPDLFSDSRKILDALLYNAVDNARKVDVLQIVFLLVEGAAISFFSACYLTFLLRAVAAQRLKLYSTFLVIPVGLTRALASQNLNLLVDDDEDEDADDEDAERAVQAAADDNDDGGGGQKLRRRATLKIDESPEMQQGSSSPGAGGGWTSGGGGGGRRFSARRNSEADPSLRNAPGEHHMSRKPFADRYDKYDKQRTLTADSSASMDGNHVNMGFCGWRGWKSRLRNLLVRRSSILPLTTSNSVPRNLHNQQSLGASGHGKRNLRFDSYETIIMLLPFIIWSVMVINMYAVAVIKMKGVDEVVAVHSVVNFMSARTSRTVFFCQELANVDNPADLMAKRAALLRVVKLLKDAWYTLQLGNQAYTALGNQTERFPLVKVGLSHASKNLETLFYSSGVCHRTNDNLPCPDSSYRFYQVTHTGLDSMMQQLMISLSSMATNSSMVPEGLEDEHFDFVYNVGYKDLLDGTSRIAEAHYDTILELFNSILLLHITLFLIFWVIFGGFLFFMLNPMLTRIAHERRRIAELMSQLPLELDVEKLVARALAPQTTGQQNGATDGDRSVANTNNMNAGGNASGNERELEATSSASKWKAIIRASSSLTGKAPSMDGRKKA